MTGARPPPGWARHRSGGAPRPTEGTWLCRSCEAALLRHRHAAARPPRVLRLPSDPPAPTSTPWPPRASDSTTSTPRTPRASRRAPPMSPGQFGIRNGVVNHGGARSGPVPRGTRPPASSPRRPCRSWTRALRDNGPPTPGTVCTFAERHSAYHFDAGFNECSNLGTRGTPDGPPGGRGGGRAVGPQRRTGPVVPPRPLLGPPHPRPDPRQLRSRLRGRPAARLVDRGGAGRPRTWPAPTRPRRCRASGRARCGTPAAAAPAGLRHGPGPQDVRRLRPRGPLRRPPRRPAGRPAGRSGAPRRDRGHGRPTTARPWASSASTATTRRPTSTRPGCPASCAGRGSTPDRSTRRRTTRSTWRRTVLERPPGPRSPRDGHGTPVGEPSLWRGRRRTLPPGPVACAPGRPSRPVRFDDALLIRTYHDGFHGYPDVMLFDLGHPHDTRTRRWHVGRTPPTVPRCCTSGRSDAQATEPPAGAYLLWSVIAEEGPCTPGSSGHDGPPAQHRGGWADRFELSHATGDDGRPPPLSSFLYYRPSGSGSGSGSGSTRARGWRWRLGAGAGHGPAAGPGGSDGRCPSPATRGGMTWPCERRPAAKTHAAQAASLRSVSLPWASAACRRLGHRREPRDPAARDAGDTSARQFGHAVSNGPGAAPSTPCSGCCWWSTPWSSWSGRCAGTPLVTALAVIGAVSLASVPPSPGHSS